MEERGLNMKELSVAAGLNETAVSDLLRRKNREINPKVTTLKALADTLNVSLEELYLGEKGSFPTIPVVGVVSAGDGWVPTHDDGHHAIEIVDLKLDPGEAVAIEIRGDSMAPVFRNGDMLIGSKRSGASADNLIGLDCIVETDDGRRFVKFLTRGRIRGRFNLRSYNPAHSDIEDVKLAWAAPILWVRRHQR